jgi:hypothetical protein
VGDFEPSKQLLAFRDHCRRMALETDTPGEVVLWVRLADEIDQYAGEPEPGEGLF